MRDLEATFEEAKLVLVPPDSADEGSAIVEIRAGYSRLNFIYVTLKTSIAGTGGREAALFSLDLCKMYQKFDCCFMIRTIRQD